MVRANFTLPTLIRKSMKSAERKNQIINSTLNIIGKSGLGGLTTAKIADDIGITEAAIYRHFKNKDDILNSTVMTIGKRLLSTIETFMGEKISPPEKLAKIYQVHTAHIQKNRGIPRVVYSQEVHSDEKLRKTLNKIIDTYLGHIRVIIDQGKESKIFKSDVDSNAEAMRFLSIIQFTAFRYSLNGFKPKAFTDSESLWKLFIRSVSKHS